jgi:hypothetical protein
MYEKSSKKNLKKSLKKITNCHRGGEGWGIVIPMPEAINFVDGRRQKISRKLIEIKNYRQF